LSDGYWSNDGTEPGLDINGTEGFGSEKYVTIAQIDESYFSTNNNKIYIGADKLLIGNLNLNYESTFDAFNLGGMIASDIMFCG
jgi:hypothetical protein